MTPLVVSVESKTSGAAGILVNTHVVFFICPGHDFDTGVLVQLRQMFLDETLLSICKIIGELNRDDPIRPLGIFLCTPEEDRSRGV